MQLAHLVRFAQLPIAVVVVAHVFLARGVKVHPVVGVIQFAGVEFLAVVEGFGPGVVKLVQGFLHFFFLPINRLVPIQQVPFADAFEVVAIGIDVRAVFFQPGILEQCVQEQRVTHVVDELTVFVVRDFVHVHVEWRNCHGLGARVEGEGNILIAWAHGE